MQNGWGTDIFPALENVTRDIVREFKKEQGVDVKRRKGKAPENYTRVAEMAGNGQALPDVAQLLLPLCYLLHGGYLTNRIRKHTLPMLYLEGAASSSSSGTSGVVLDVPALSQSDLRRLQRGAGSGCGSDPGSD